MKRALLIVAVALLFSLPAMGQVSFVNKCTGTTSCASVPAHQAGDLFIAFCGRDASTAGCTLPPGWTSMGTASINGTSTADSSVLAACKVALGSSETVTGFTGGGALTTHIYRGAAVLTTATCASGNGTPNFFSSTINTTTTTETFNTVTNAKSTSWDVGFGYAPAATAGIATAPATMTNRSSQGTILGGHDSNGGVASFSAANVTLTTAGRIITGVVEIKAPTADAPVITPNGGSFSNDTTFTITNGGSAVASPGFCYTTDGTTPNSTDGTTCSVGTLYSGAVTVGATATTVKAIAIKSGANNSAVTTSTAFTLTAATPIASPATESFVGSVSVSLTAATTGATIHSTSDGSSPTCSSGTTTSFSISATTTIKSVACKANYVTSAIQSDTYTLHTPAQYYVKTTGIDSNNGTSTSTPFLTIGKCAAVMAAGDTCTVFAGTYNEHITIPAGAAGSYVIFNVNGTDVANVLDFTAASHSKIVGFHIQNPSSPNSSNCITLPSGTTDVFITGNTLYACGNSAMIKAQGTPYPSYVYIQNNTLSYSCSTSAAPDVCDAIDWNGSHWLIDANDFSHVLEAISGAGDHTVIRNSVLHDTYGRDPSGIYGQTDCIPTLSAVVNTSGTTVTWVSGGQFYNFFPATKIVINGVRYTVATAASTTITLTASAGTQSGVAATGGNGSNCHMNMVITEPPSSIPSQYNLVEGNTERNLYGSDGHVFLAQGDACGGLCHNLIIRFNVADHVGAGGVVNDNAFNSAVNPGFYNVKSYNNSWVDMANYPGQGSIIGVNSFTYNSTGGASVNELFYFTTSGINFNPYICDNGNAGASTCASFVGKYNIAFINGTGSLLGQVYNAGTFTTDAGNVVSDPMFSNYGTNDLHLQAGSPAKATGANLTTVTSGCNTATLVLADAAFFQDGMGLTGVSPDVLSVGTAGNTASVSSVNYSTNTVTFAGTVTCTNGASVWLKNLSDGTNVLTGSAPNMGALDLAIAPAVSLNPTSLTYTAQTVNTPSASKPVTVTNTGNASLTVSSIVLTGGTEFAQTNDCSTVAAGGTCTINVTFTPLTNTGTAGDVMTVNTNATNPTVSLSGARTGPPSTLASLDANGRNEVHVCRGQSATLNWTVSGGSGLACSIDNGVGALTITDLNGTTGSNSVSPTATTTYTVSCSSATGSASANAKVNVGRCGGPF